jgi:hypothetical protein
MADRSILVELMNGVAAMKAHREGKITLQMDVHHDIHDFVASSQRTIEEEYERIRSRAAEDPGTAGDQGEENWAGLLRMWLPSYFHVVTKGRILTESGYMSPQIDVLVLLPSYPAILRDKKHYLAGGVAAAFECKLTLKAEHLEDSVRKAAELRRNLPKRAGSPYRELHSTITYGLLAHSHSWKGKESTPIANVEDALWKSDGESVQHPRECLDLITVADLATWRALKLAYLGPQPVDLNIENVSGSRGAVATSYICSRIGGEGQGRFFSPLGVLLSHLFSQLAWTFPDMRGFEQYFRNAGLWASGSGRGRLWGLEVYSERVRDRVQDGPHPMEGPFDEWRFGY